VTTITRTRGPWKVATEVHEKGSSRPLVIELDPLQCRIRPKGLRTGYALTWHAIYRLGALAQAEAARNARLEARAARNTRNNTR